MSTLKRAGAVVLGKTAMDEFAYCEPPPTKNPRDLRRTPGGSSGGSAAAVAAGICPFAVGSQTLQSVIVPAAYCGVVGYKTHVSGGWRSTASPSLRRWTPWGSSLRRSTICAPAPPRSSLAGTNRATSATPPILGVLEPWGPSRLVEGGWRAHAGHLEILRDRRVRTPAQRACRGTSARHVGAGACASGICCTPRWRIAHAPWFDRFADLYRPRTAEAVRAGRDISAERLQECRDARPILAGQLQEGRIDDAGSIAGSARRPGASPPSDTRTPGTAP